jgi:DNA mismatch repair protein MutS2
MARMTRINKKKGVGIQTPLLDLHGYKTEDVPDAVDRFLRTAMSRNLPEVRIMTGKGTGAVKRTVMEYLRLGQFPFAPARGPNTQINDGVLVVFLGD